MKNPLRYVGFVVLFAILGGGSVLLAMLGWPPAFHYRSEVGSHWLFWPYLADLIVHAALPGMVLYLARHWIWSGDGPAFGQ